VLRCPLSPQLLYFLGRSSEAAVAQLGHRPIAEPAIAK
jgi:hypothetical protein